MRELAQAFDGLDVGALQQRRSADAVPSTGARYTARVKRLLSLAVALAIAGAPMASTACELVCRSMSTPLAGHHVHGGSSRETVMPPDASCHHANRVASRVSPQTRACDHHGEARVFGDVAVRLDASVLPIASPGPAVDPVVLTRAAASVEFQPAAPPHRLDFHLATPLRV